MKAQRIPLANGGFTTVSAEDFEWLNEHEWRELSGRAVRRDGDSIISMHVEIVRPEPGMEVDHINRDPLDNRRENLRECTYAENLRNRGPYRNNQTGYVGVQHARTPGKYIAAIGHERRTIYLGTFDSAEAAARAYDSAALHFHREYATINFPEAVKPYSPRLYRPQQKTSAFRGVCWVQDQGKWMAQLRKNGKRVFRKYFDDEVEAAKAYDRAARTHHGLRARLNFPIDHEQTTELKLAA